MRIDLLNKILWAIAISLLVLNSVYFTIKLRFPQFQIIKILKSIKKTKSKENLTPVDTLIIALSSKIGVGALSGTAISIYYGGLGTIFWMYVSTFFLSIINYIENGLSIIYKDKTNNKSGPSYYMQKGLNKKVLSMMYAIIIIITYIFIFSSIQTNTITSLIHETYSTNKILIAGIVTFLSGILIIKGIKTVSNVCNKIFPIMMLLFISVSLFIIIKNISNLPYLINKILKDAFNTNSVSGGIIYTIIITFQRSVFANESGVGTSAIISGETDSNDYKTQAKIGLIQTYFINFVILGLTSFIIGLSDVYNVNINNGIELTKYAFSYHMGLLGDIFLLVILCLFSFSTIITIYYYGESSLRFITKKKQYKKILKVFTLLSIFIGGIIKASIIWKLVDISLAILIIINMYAINKLKLKIISKLKEK